MPTVYSEQLSRFVEYEVVWDGRGSLTDGTGWRQREHPMDRIRRNGSGTERVVVNAVKNSHIKKHRPRGQTYFPIACEADQRANVLSATGKGWRLMTRDHPNATPCPTCVDGFLRPKEAARRFRRCVVCRGSQWR